MTDEDRKLIHQLAKDETIGERIIASIAPSGMITRCCSTPVRVQELCTVYILGLAIVSNFWVDSDSYEESNG